MANESSNELQGLIQDFLDHIEVERGVSKLTVRNYKHYLNRFAAWVLEEGIAPSLSEITQAVVRQYRLYLSRFTYGQGRTLSRTLSRKTQGYHIIALRAFLRWLIRTDRQALSPDKIDLPKGESHSLKFLNAEQVERLLNSPSLSTITGKRDRAILEVLFSTGLRVSELVSLNREKVDLDRREFGVIGKGGKPRVVFLSQRSVDWVQRYLNARDDHYKPLFIRHKLKDDPTNSDAKMRLSVRTIQRLIKKYAQKVNIPVDVTPHVIRHSFATDLLMAGADLRSVQEMLGHKNVSTTQIYTHITNPRLRDIHENYHGKGKQ